MSTKRCFVCGKDLPLEGFYRHPQMTDGHLNKCIECCKRQSRQNRHKRADYYQEYEKRRRERPEKRQAENARSRERSRKERAKWRTRLQTRRAVEKGKIERKPCAFCGDPNVEAHHPDYGDPLNVVWVCRTCHMKHFHPAIED